MSSLFGSSSATATTSTPDLPSTSLRVQTALEGKARARLWGCTRIPGNLIWYGDFNAIAQASSAPQASGGKGGIFSSSQPSSGTSSGYNYYASLQLALTEGPIQAITKMWASKAVTSLAETGFAIFAGGAAQAQWGYLQSAHPDQSFTYRFTAYVAGNISLGTSAELPNWTFETIGSIASGAPGVVDAAFTDFLADFLSNQMSGVPGWQPTYDGDWSYADVYTTASGLFISYALTEQTSAQSLLAEMFESVNCMSVWSGGMLKIVPLGDTQVTGNGQVYNPPVAPIYDLDDSDFLPNQAGFGGTNVDPVSAQRKAPRDKNNVINVEYLDRAADYDPAVASARDDGAIVLYGERGSAGTKSWHWLQLNSAANMAAQLALGREQVANSYSFTLRPRYVLLDPGDIISITDAELGLFRQWVRITDIQENADRSLNFLVDEYLQGTGAAPLYGREVASGASPDYNADPGDVNVPIIFEPTDQLGGGLQIWMGVSGVDQTMYGGCDVWGSYDGTNYVRIPNGRIFGDSRMGVLTAPLPAFSVSQVDQTIDTTNAIFVDLGESDGELVSGSQADALALNTICYVDGEIVAYQTASLSGTNKYTLTYLVRNAYGTEAENVAHATGSNFLRLDNSIVRVPFDQTRIGSTVYFKFIPFNVWGGGGKTLADVPAFAYTITGAALSSPLPDVQNVRTVFEAGFSKIWWEEVQDFRTGIRYIVKKGPSYASAQDLGSLAHPPFVAFGPGVYWIVATAQPIPDLLVYSETPSSITIQGNMLLLNIIATNDWQALGWPGTFVNVEKEGTDPTALLRLSASGNVLTLPNILTTPDLLNLGTIFPTGEYDTALANVLDVGYVADCYVNAAWTSLGIPIAADILSDTDFLNNPDILSAGSSAFVEVWVEIRFATDKVAGVIQWGAWQRFVPGVYRAEWIQFRVIFESLKDNIIAYLTTFVTQVTIPPRIDHYVGNSVGTGGLTITFEPDDAIAAKPFNGGVLVGGTSNHPLPQVTMDWPGNAGVNFVIDSLSLSAVTFHFENSVGTHIAVSGVDVVVEGY